MSINRDRARSVLAIVALAVAVSAIAAVFILLGLLPDAGRTVVAEIFPGAD